MSLDLFHGGGEAADGRVCLDVGHAVAEGLDPVRVLDRLGVRVAGLHLHDAVPRGPASPGDAEEAAHRPLGEGALDLDALVRALAGRSFRGPVILEVLGDQVPSALRWREAIARVGPGGGSA
ncbi:MAG: sugar phosphate isomerase/epimerase [Firmicutes bacterium]|nr:sugar phosphate isomerase/epimerase [Bacillota bacterium]